MSEISSSRIDKPDWKAGWTDNERAQLQAWLKATPAQRLAWLEEALILAYRAGALGPGAEQQD
jgi:hypothetical protein